MNETQSFYQRFKTPINYGLLAGVFLLFVGLVGMLEDFADREIVRSTLTLAQLLIYLPAFIAGYMMARKEQSADTEPLPILVYGAVVGVLGASLTLILLFLNVQFFPAIGSEFPEFAQDMPELNEIFVNLNRDWREVITFEEFGEELRTSLEELRSRGRAEDDLFTFENWNNIGIGSLILLTISAGFSLLGTIIALLPRKLSRAVMLAGSITLLIGVFGETVGLILEQLLPDDVLDAIFRRDVLKQTPAVVLLGLTLVGTLIWSYGGKSIRENYDNLPKSTQTATNYLALAIVAAIFLFLPLIIGRALSDAAVTIGLFVLMGLGLNIAIGLAGLLDLGYVTNYAVGAYLMAIMTSRGPLGVSDNIANWLNNLAFIPAEFFAPNFVNFWLVLPLCVLAAMFTGFIFALPVLKMRGDYLAIATLGFGEIIGKLVISDWFSPVLGGPQGVSFVPDPAVPALIQNEAGQQVFGFLQLSNPGQIYYVVLFACLLTLFVSIRLNNSRIGRQWMAIREDEDVAEAMGINVARSKLLAFTLSAATGGLAGAIFAAKIGTVLPSSFTVFVSINVLSLIIVGGIGSNPGIFVGALVLIGMPELLREFSEYRFLLYGALLIFMMVNRPEGLWPSQVTKRELAGDDEETGDPSRPKPVAVEA